MSNVTALASRRNGVRTGCGAGSRRIMVTLPEQIFNALRARADAHSHGLSGEAALIIEEKLSASVNRVPNTPTEKNAENDRAASGA